MNKKRVVCVLAVICLIAGIFYSPIKIYADIEWSLDRIETTELEFSGVYEKIKNAAILHLIMQKLKSCKGSMPFDSALMANWRGGADDVENEGDMFVSSTVDIGVGPWFGNVLDGASGRDGDIKCAHTGKTTMLDVVAWLFKNYNNDGLSSGNFSGVTVEDRRKIICDYEDPAKPGLLMSSNILGDKTDTPCEDAGFYTADADQFDSYFQKLYNRMKEANLYLPNYEDIDFFNKVDGYYLYMKDFQIQCGDAWDNFVEDDGWISGKDNSGRLKVMGYKIDEVTGKVRRGYFPINIESDKEIQSFVEEKLTCRQIVEGKIGTSAQGMNGAIREYLSIINNLVYSNCRDNIAPAIENKRKEIDDEYPKYKRTDEEDKIIDEINEEYNRIINEEEYLAYVDGESEILVAKNNYGDVESEYILTCRSSLPFIKVKTVEQGALDDAIEEAFYDACYDSTISLPWLICPVINWVSDTVDELSKMLDGFF